MSSSVWSECEFCSKSHNELYGSGRFCCQKCARTFASLINRQERNKKISQKQIGKPSKLKGKVGHTPTKETILKIKEGVNRRWRIKKEALYNSPWDSLSTSAKRWLFIKEKQSTCEQCGWNKIHPISNRQLCQIHHKDGKDKNWDRNNIQLLCPNCHSLTNNYMFHGRKGKNSHSKS